MTRFPRSRFPLLFCPLLAVVSSSLALAQSPEPASLFDGETLDGWESTKGVWRVEDGAITASSHDKNFPRNECICTQKSYANFDLTLKIKCSGDLTTGQVNSGIQIRSARLPDGGVAGYQIDCGKGWFGKIYDEHRRRLTYDTPVDEAALLKGVEIIDAFFVSEDKDAVVIRQIGVSDRRISKNQIASTRFIRRSLMPEGLLDALADEQAADLLAYLMNSKGATPQ